MRSWIRFLSLVVAQACFLAVLGTACVYRPRDERILIVEPTTPSGSESAAQSIVKALQMHPSADANGFSLEEICRLVHRYPELSKKLFGTADISVESVAEVLDGLDRNSDSFFSPEELAQGILDKLPLVKAMHGTGILSAANLDAYLIEAFPEAIEVQRDTLAAYLMRYDAPVMGGNGDGMLGIAEARFPSIALFFSGRLTPSQLKSSIALTKKLQPTERKFLSHAMEYKMKQEGLNTGAMAGWGAQGIFSDQEPKGDQGRILAILFLLRLDQVYRLTTQGVEPPDMLEYFYRPTAPIAAKEWAALEGLYRVKSTKGEFALAFENTLLLSDIEVADRLFRGSYATGANQSTLLAFLFPKALLPVEPRFESLEQTVEHLNARFLTHSFFKSYDSNGDLRLDRKEFETGIRQWNGDVSQMTYVFFNRSENDIDPSQFLQRGWTTLRPYLWDL